MSLMRLSGQQAPGVTDNSVSDGSPSQTTGQFIFSIPFPFSFVTQNAIPIPITFGQLDLIISVITSMSLDARIYVLCNMGWFIPPCTTNFFAHINATSYHCIKAQKEQ